MPPQPEDDPDRITKATGRPPTNARNSTFQREQQSFTSRRQGQAQHERHKSQPDFFTASANTSYIPTPSPTKATKSRAGFNGKARQPIGHGRSLSGAHKTAEARPRRDPTLPTASSLNRSGPRSRTTPTPPPGPSSSARATSSTPTRSSPAAARASARTSTTRPRNRPAEEETKQETPSKTPTRSPHRDTQETLKSPASSTSSPPRELTDAYQRIEDEELIAGQEGEENDDVFSDDQDYLGQDYLSQIPEEERAHQRSSPQSVRTGSPVSRRSSRPNSALRSDDTIAPAHSPIRQNSMHSSDDPSSPSFLRNSDDDTFSKMRTQYENDERRLQEVLGSDKQAFSKSRRHGRSGLTLENLRRKDNVSPSKSSPLGSLGSVSESSFSDPAFNVPKDWGSKSRGDRRWLRRFDRDGRSIADESSKSLRDSGMMSETEPKLGPPIIKDWLKSASETALPFVEGSAKTDISPRKGPTSGATQRRGISQSSLSRIRETDLDGDDSSAHSLQTSDSPPKRTSTLNILRSREIENLEKKTLTTHRLGELREKKSIDHIRRRSPSISSIPNEVIREEDLTEKEDTPARPRSPTSLHRPRSSLGDYSSRPRDSTRAHGNLEKSEAVDDLADSAVMVSKVDDNKLTKSLSTGDNPLEHSPRSLQRPSHDRHDSIDLLRNLARVTSASPSPRLIPAGQSGEMASENHGKSVETSGGRRVSEKPKPRSQSPSKIPVREQTLPYGKMEARSQPILQSTPLPPKPLTNAKTPHITGGWIDTPATKPSLTSKPSPTRRDFAAEAAPLARDILQERSANGTLSPPLPSPESTAPKLPESTLSAILAEQRAKSKTKAARRSVEIDELPKSPKFDDSDPEALGDITLNLGEDTIQSLEALVAPDTDIDRILRPPSPEKKSSSSTKAASPRKRRSSSSSPKKRASSASHGSRPPTPGVEQDKPAKKASKPKTKTEVEDEDSPAPTAHLPLMSRLSHLASSIHDAKQSLSSLSSAVARQPDFSLSSEESEVDADGECVEAGGQFHDFVWPCKRCGCRGGGNLVGGKALVGAGGWAYDENLVWNWQPLVVPVPVLWRWRRGDRVPRLTGVGWWVFGLGGFVLGEVIACKYWIPPFYLRPGHRYGDAYGIDYSLPKPPFLFPKLVYRQLPDPMKRVVYPLVVQMPFFVLSMIVRFLALLFGFDPGAFGPDGGVMPRKRYVVVDKRYRYRPGMENEVWLS